MTKSLLVAVPVKLKLMNYENDKVLMSLGLECKNNLPFNFVLRKTQLYEAEWNFEYAEQKKEGVKYRPPQFSHTKAEWSEGDTLQSAQFPCMLCAKKMDCPHISQLGLAAPLCFGSSTFPQA